MILKILDLLILKNVCQMKTLNALLLDLSVLDQSSSDYFSEFEKILSQIIALKNADSIAPLIASLDDQSPFDELMFSIIHGIESFDNTIYIKALLKKVSVFCETSPRWASIVFMRILNSETARLELVRQLRSAEQPVKISIKLLMEKINARDVRFLAKTTVVIVAATV
jgi:hypothetical protein